MCFICAFLIRLSVHFVIANAMEWLRRRNERKSNWEGAFIASIFFSQIPSSPLLLAIDQRRQCMCLYIDYWKKIGAAPSQKSTTTMLNDDDDDGFFLSAILGRFVFYFTYKTPELTFSKSVATLCNMHWIHKKATATSTHRDEHEHISLVSSSIFPPFCCCVFVQQHFFRWLDNDRFRDDGKRGKLRVNKMKNMFLCRQRTTQRRWRRRLGEVHLKIADVMRSELYWIQSISRSYRVDSSFAVSFASSYVSKTLSTSVQDSWYCMYFTSLATSLALSPSLPFTVSALAGSRYGGCYFNAGAE